MRSKAAKTHEKGFEKKHPIDVPEENKMVKIDFWNFKKLKNAIDFDNLSYKPGVGVNL